MLRIVISLVIAAHGIGHILFLAPMLRAEGGMWSQVNNSWLLGDSSLVRLVGALLWAAVLVLFVVAALGLFTQQPFWRTAAIIASILSVIGLVIFWHSPPGSPVISALVFNVCVLVALLLAHWPSYEMVGA